MTAALIIAVFVVGYIAITLEHSIRVNKAATALLAGVTCWTIFMLGSPDTTMVLAHLSESVAEISQILLFLMAAMTIVELIDLHDGFDVITSRVTTRNRRILLLLVCFFSFFLSAVLDNLTTAIVMVSLLTKMISEPKERALYIGMVIIAANAGGAWSPIGDITTTMLWIKGLITPDAIIGSLFLPSLACIAIPALIVSARIRGCIQPQGEITDDDSREPQVSRRHRFIVFFSGVTILLLIPVFKTVTHLPPFMGILLGLGAIWLLTELLHIPNAQAPTRRHTVEQALKRIDMSSVLFFLGILLCVAALQQSGQLAGMSAFLDNSIGDVDLIALSIGLLSAIVDNVPLVAGAMGMYPQSVYPADHHFWHFLAYCAGTGGSILLIGSAAGVAAMGMAKIGFFWYIRNISLLALAGYLSGAAVYILA